MFCALLTSRYQVSVYRTNGPLVDSCSYCMAIKNTIVVQQAIQTFRVYKEPEKSL